jgi:hypothetical protein
MAQPPRTPPRFVPTLTDVVRDAGPAVVRPQAPVQAVRPSRALPDGIEEHLIHRVMQRVDLVLDQRLREAITLVVQEQTRSVVPRLREEVEAVVRHAVYEAVAQELAGGDEGRL